MRKITIDEFDRFYEIMETSFPKSELRPYALMKEMFNNQDLVVYGVGEETLIGAMIAWELDSCLFLENFAVDKSFRGQGIGASILKGIADIYKNQTIILEVEKPYDAISERRVAFYERNHFALHDLGYMQPALNEEINEVPLLIMSYDHKLKEEDFSKMQKEIFKKVYRVED